MSNRSSISSNSLKIDKNKVADSIPCRIDFIKSLLHGKSIKPLVNFDNTDTECFINVNDKDENGSKTSTLNKSRKKTKRYRGQGR